MGMFSFLKAPEHIGTALNAVIKTGDALVYTEEEKAETRKEMTKIHLRHIELTNKENTATSIARRWLAMVITIPFVLLTMGSAVLHISGKAEMAAHLQELAMEDYSNLVMMVAVFYFGAHIVKGMKK